MSYWIADVTFTGNVKNKKKPEDITLIFKERNFDLACKRVASFSKRKWPFWRFELSQEKNLRILK